MRRSFLRARTGRGRLPASAPGAAADPVATVASAGRGSPASPPAASGDSAGTLTGSARAEELSEREGRRARRPSPGRQAPSPLRSWKSTTPAGALQSPLKGRWAAMPALPGEARPSAAKPERAGRADSRQNEPPGAARSVGPPPRSSPRSAGPRLARGLRGASQRAAILPRARSPDGAPPTPPRPRPRA